MLVILIGVTLVLIILAAVLVVLAGVSFVLVFLARIGLVLGGRVAPLVGRSVIPLVSSVVTPLIGGVGGRGGSAGGLVLLLTSLVRLLELVVSVSISRHAHLLRVVPRSGVLLIRSRLVVPVGLIRVVPAGSLVILVLGVPLSGVLIRIVSSGAANGLILQSSNLRRATPSSVVRSILSLTIRPESAISSVVLAFREPSGVSIASPILLSAPVTTVATLSIFAIVAVVVSVESASRTSIVSPSLGVSLFTSSLGFAPRSSGVSARISPVS